MKQARKTNRPTKGSEPIHVVEHPTMSEIQGRIYKSVSSVGIGELYFEIGRKTNRGSGGFSFKFVPRHVYALNEVAILATQWIQENPLAADGVFPQPKKEADNLNTDSKTV